MTRSTPKMATVGLLLGLVLAWLVSIVSYNESTPTRENFAFTGDEPALTTTDYGYWLAPAVSGAVFAALGWAIAAGLRRYDRSRRP